MNVLENLNSLEVWPLAIAGAATTAPFSEVWPTLTAFLNLSQCRTGGPCGIVLIGMFVSGCLPWDSLVLQTTACIATGRGHEVTMQQSGDQAVIGS